MLTFFSEVFDSRLGIQDMQVAFESLFAKGVVIINSG